MENRQQQILSEIKEMMSLIRTQLEQLDVKMAELQYEVDPQEFTSEPIDLSLDDFTIETVPEDPVVEEMAVVFEEPVIEEVGLPVEENFEEPDPELDEDLLEEPVAEEISVEEDDDLPFFDDPADLPAGDSEDLPAGDLEDLPAGESEQQSEPVAAPVIVNDAVQASNQKTVVLDAMIAKQAWRTDMPGAPVRDIRSAISLNDRVLFINRLFGEDPVNFQETLNILNQMGSLDEAVAYLVETHPSWNLESELVYRFMMALRRKLN